MSDFPHTDDTEVISGIQYGWNPTGGPNGTGQYERIKSTDGASHVASLGINGTPMSYAKAGQNGSPDSIIIDPPAKQVTVSFVRGTNIPEGDEGLVFCLNAPNAGVRDNWLTETNMGVPRHKVGPNEESTKYGDGELITLVSFKSTGSVLDNDVTIEAII